MKLARTLTKRPTLRKPMAASPHAIAGIGFNADAIESMVD